MINWDFFEIQYFMPHLLLYHFFSRASKHRLKPIISHCFTYKKALINCPMSFLKLPFSWMSKFIFSSLLSYSNPCIWFKYKILKSYYFYSLILLLTLFSFINLNRYKMDHKLINFYLLPSFSFSMTHHQPLLLLLPNFIWL